MAIKNTKLASKQIIKSGKSAQDEGFVSQDSLHSQLDAQYNVKRIFFKGTGMNEAKMLAPYNRTYKELTISALKPNDSATFSCWILCFLLIRGEEIYQAALVKYSGNIEVAEDSIDTLLPLEVEDGEVEKFRARVRKWSRRFTDKEAEDLSDKILKMRREANLGRVTPPESDTTPGK